MDEEQKRAETQETEEEDDLSAEEEMLRKEQKQLDEFVGMADRTLNRWNAGQSEDVRQSVIDSFVESGEIDHEAAGVAEIEAEVVMAAFTMHVERNVLKPLGLTLSQWQTYVDQSDLPAFRKAAVGGDWSAFHGHAQRVATHIHLNGDVNADL